MKNLRAVVFGPPGQGKTFSCITLSEKCPAAFSHIKQGVVKHPERVNLDDLLYIMFDSGGLDGLLEQNLSVPMIDASHTPTKDVKNVCKEVVGLAADRVKAGKTKVVIIDTVTALNGMLETFYKEQGLSGFDLYGNVKVEHLKFALGLKGLPCDIIFLCHAKAVFDNGDVAQQTKIRASGQATIIPAITGDALNHYRGDSTFVFSCRRATEGGKDGRWFYAEPSMGFDAKTRLQLDGLKAIPADWRFIKQKAGK